MTFHSRFNAFQIDCIFHVLRARFIKYNVCVQCPVSPLGIHREHSFLSFHSFQRLFFFAPSPFLSTALIIALFFVAHCPNRVLFLFRSYFTFPHCFYFVNFSNRLSVIHMYVYHTVNHMHVSIGVGMSAQSVCFFLFFSLWGGRLSSTYSVTGAATIPVLAF